MKKYDNTWILGAIGIILYSCLLLLIGSLLGGSAAPANKMEVELTLRDGSKWHLPIPNSDMTFINAHLVPEGLVITNINIKPIPK